MTSATVIYPPPPLMRFPPQKRGVTGAPYTTITRQGLLGRSRHDKGLQVIFKVKMIQ